MVVALTGRKRSGKDEAAKAFVERGFTKYAFADPIRKAVADFFLWDESYFNTEKKEQIDPRWGLSPRHVMQNIGTEWGQFHLMGTFEQFRETTGRRLWANRFKYLCLNSPDTNWVVSDMRFLHEAEAIRELGGSIVKVVDPSSEGKDTHASETEIDAIEHDYKIVNGATLEDLHKMADMIAVSIVGY